MDNKDLNKKDKTGQRTKSDKIGRYEQNWTKLDIMNKIPKFVNMEKKNLAIDKIG